MQIEKHKEAFIKQKYFFIKGDLKLTDQAVDYFIQKIEEGIKLESNMSGKTNVYGEMTSYNFFVNDINFFKVLLSLNDYIDNNHLTEGSYTLCDAWGIKESFSHYTDMHKHTSFYISGVIYLNDTNEKLYFPEIDEIVESKKNKFAIFSPFLKHGTKKRINDDTIKYGLAFNWGCSNPSENIV